MGDMLRCPQCGTFHYRNDPCPEEYDDVIDDDIYDDDEDGWLEENWGCREPDSD